MRVFRSEEWPEITYFVLSSKKALPQNAKLTKRPCHSIIGSEMIYEIKNVFNSDKRN
jgi:hypothetical protein